MPKINPDEDEEGEEGDDDRGGEVVEGFGGLLEGREGGVRIFCFFGFLVFGFFLGGGEGGREEEG